MVDQLLEYGYAVRTTVRSLERSKWMMPLFKSRHPNAQLEVVEVSDISVSGCYDMVLKGVSAVIHTPAFTNMSDPEMVANTIKININAMDAVREANKNGESIQRFVLTGSSWAVKYPTPNVPGDITEGQYDESIAKTLADPNTPKEAWPLMGYVMSKIAGEQACWKYVREHSDCGFVLNTVIPATCFGPVLSPEDQAYPSTAGFVRALYECKNQELFDVMEPQWYVDVRDQARLHVAGAVLNDVEHRRMFAWAGTYTWPGAADVLEQEMGTRTTIRLADKGNDLTKVLAKDKAEGYLKRLSRSDWVPFNQSIQECIRSFYPKA